MSLLRTSAASVQVTVIVREMREDSRGRPQAVELDELVCHGHMHNATTDELAAYAAPLDQAVLTLKTFTTSYFPGDHLSIVVDADGRRYEVVGEVQRFRRSRRTARDRVTLRAINAERGIADGHRV